MSDLTSQEVTETPVSAENAETGTESQGASAPAAKSGFDWKAAAQKVLKFLQKWSWAGLLFLAVFLIGYYTLFPSRGYFHSDSTDTLMWAVASSESGSLFNPDFSYACLLPFGTTLIMWALIPIFGVTMTTHVIGMFVFFLLFTGAMIWMLRKMDWNWGWISVAVFVELMICSGSEKLREIFWGHTIYYSLGVLFIFVGLALLFHCMEQFRKRALATEPDKKKKQTIWLFICIVLLCLWFVLTCMNQIISIAIFALPVMAALFCERWLDGDSRFLSKPTLRAGILFGVMGVGMVLGYLVTVKAADGIVAGYEGAFSNYSGMETWAEHVNGFPQAWLSLLGATMRDGEPLMSVKSVGDLLIVITGVILLVTPVIALAFYKKIEDKRLRILILTYWFMFMLIMMGYIMGRLSNANWRLSPIVAMSAMVTVAFIRWAVGKVEMQRVMSLLLIPVLMVCSVTAFTIAKMPADNTQDNHLYRLAEGLESYGLSYGYATFWNANGLTVASDSKVKVRSVNIDSSGCTPYYYQSCRSWFDKQAGQERYFLLMSQYERDQLAGSSLESTKTGEVMIDGYCVWIYNDNLF